jgi:hypothetical protein
LAGYRGAKEVVGEGKTAESAVGWEMLILRDVLALMKLSVEVSDVSTYLLERIALAGLSGATDPR